MMDANDDIRIEGVQMALAKKLIYKAITTKDGDPVPPMCDKGKQPINEIIQFLTLQIVWGGYIPLRKQISSDHHGICLNIACHDMFSQNLPEIIRPRM